MEQSNIFTGIADNNTLDYETIGDRTEENYDKLEMQPNRSPIAVYVNYNGETKNDLFSNTKRNIFIRKVVCIGILFAVIAAIGAVIMYSYMSSRTQACFSCGSCKPYTYIKHGHTTRSTGSSHGDILEVKCDKKSKLNGSNTIICLSTGKWSASTNCILKDCGALVLNQNMQKESETNRTTVGSVIPLSCKKGFTLSGNTSAVCQDDEQWSEIPTCRRVDCGPPNGINNSKPTSLETTTYNSSFIVDCLEGHVLIGTEKVTCNIDGHWDELPICKVVSCGIPKEPPHATIKHLIGTSFQSNVSMKCDDGYVMHGNPLISCKSNGKWTDLPSCDRTEMTACRDIYNREGEQDDGIYTVKTWKTHQEIKVYCDMTTASGGWTVIQHRFDKSVDFFRNFTEYENGFGDLTSEFWLGLKYIQEITSQGSTYLRIDVEADNGTDAFEIFNMFKLSPRPAYTLSLGDTMCSNRIYEINRFGKRANGTGFSTFDNDVDTLNRGNCASEFQGGWWYDACFGADLNGREIYYHGFISSAKLKSSKMIIKRN